MFREFAGRTDHLLPACGSDNVQTDARHATMPYRCREKGCAKKFSTRYGTLMESSKLGYQVWVVMMHQVATHPKGVSSLQIHRDLEMTQRSSWFAGHRLRMAWEKPVPKFEGPVEADETYIAGQAKPECRPSGGAPRKGRGTAGKFVVAGVLDRTTNQVSAAAVPNIKTLTLTKFVHDRTTDDAQVYTDELMSYNALRRKRGIVEHGAHQYVDGDAHTNSIESFWATIKRAYKGTFHSMSEKHLNRYVTEFAGRHNFRTSYHTHQTKRRMDVCPGCQQAPQYSDLVS